MEISAFELARQAELASILADIVRDYRTFLHGNVLREGA